VCEWVFIFKIEEQKRTEKIGTNKPQKKRERKRRNKETINTMKFFFVFSYTHTQAHFKRAKEEKENLVSHFLKSIQDNFKFDLRSP
jgi:hypothetical protein